MPSPIDDYLGKIDHKLGFDRSLALRAREDIEEYCHDVAGERRMNPREAEKMAIEGFGDADSVAQLYAASALGYQVRKTWLSLALLVVGAFLAMRLRTLSLGPLATGDGSLLLLADRISLAAGLSFALLGWLRYRQPDFPLRLMSARTAFDLSLLAIGTSIMAGTIRAAMAFNADIDASHVFLVLITVMAEFALLLAVHARVRKLGCYFDRASTAG
jgi:hypothetical protein